MKNNVNNVVPVNECTGCGACSVKCPKNCIEIIEDSKGFVVPKVDFETCVECGTCIKVCPSINLQQTSKPLSVFVACLRDKILLKSATSGGAFTAFALAILNKGGVVYGASWGNNLDVEHICIEEKSKLELLQGSKYVQSKTYNCFPAIKNYLEKGRDVLFCGTGCQVAGLRSFLKKDYVGLLTIELVCHGVPSPGLFRKYVEWLGRKKGGVISSFCFRCKKKRPTGEHSEFFYVCNGKHFYGHSYEDPYYGSFLKGRTLRPSCYQCKYKGEKRIADVTLGDFWGIEKSHPNFPTKYGHSLIIINTKKGEHYFTEISQSLEYIEATWNEATKKNHSLIKPTNGSAVDYDLESPSLFYKDLKVKISIKDFIKNRIPWRLKWILKKYI